jgi:hypothetical protein
MTERTKPKNFRRLTPANDAKFEDIPVDVSIKYFH